MPSDPDFSAPADMLHIKTLGGFQVTRRGALLAPTAWGREAALHLFQFLVTMRRYHARQHKEQIIERLWSDDDLEKGERNFKVALNAVYRAIEPERPPRADSRYVRRIGLTYTLDPATTWVDADAFEDAIAEGNRHLPHDKKEAIVHFHRALALYRGDFLPERRYEDWTSAERERLQVLALGLMTTLARLLLTDAPLETIRLTEQVLSIDPVWEDAYRLQMRAYVAQGNRPLALRTYQRCVDVLAAELALDPLPETQALFNEIRAIK